MKIAVFHELHNGGARRAVNEFAKVLKKNHQVDLYIVDKIQLDDERNYFDSIHLYKFYPRKWIKGNWKSKLYKDSIELFKLARLHQKIATNIDHERYDFVFVHPSQFTQAPFILRFLKTKKIYYCEEPLRIVYDKLLAARPTNNIGKDLYEKINRLVRKKIDLKNIYAADIILANSQYSKKLIDKVYNVTSIHTPLGVDTNFFTPTKLKKEYDVLYIGARDDIDGYPFFKEVVQLMKQAPKVKYHITGEDWLKDEKAFVKLYQQSKIVVCLAKNEPFGLIPLEAMSCEVPVVAVAEGGYKETVIDGKTGYLIPREKITLAKILNNLLVNDVLREELGKNGRKVTITKWDWNIVGKTLESLFKKL